MKVSNNIEVTWNQVDTTTFMYGTTFKFKDDYTLFENHLMPSGIIMQEWTMFTSFSKDKAIPSLPILKKGCTYHFNFDYTVTPENSIYFKLIFYKKNGSVIDTKIINDLDIEIYYPKDAHTYKLQMINAASQSLKFKKLTICEVNEQINTVQIGELLNKNEAHPMLNIIFVEPTTQQQTTVSSEAIRKFENVLLIKGWYNGKLTDGMSMIKQHLTQNYSDCELNLIGYGPLSNEFSKAMSHIIEGQPFITFHQNTSFAKKLSEVIGENNQSHPITKPYVYFDTETHRPHGMEVMQPVLNKTRYLEYLDIRTVKNGGTNETKNRFNN